MSLMFYRPLIFLGNMRSHAQRILSWYAQHGRDLPWRRTTDPYALFMSELMLQQTQVDRVIPLWQNWLKLFPNWKALAEAKTADIIQAWAGLGYNRRALYAREAAQHIKVHGLPSTEVEWLSIKGVGPYMAAALAAFIQHERTLVIDTNIRRVIGRAFLQIAFPAPTDDVAIRTCLASLVPTRGKHWDIPQALMDIASAHCFHRRPDCSHCPLASICLSRQFFLSNPDAKKIQQASREKIHEEKEFPDRIYRGRILKLVREYGKYKIAHLGAQIDPHFSIRDQEWVEKMVQRMLKDGLVEKTGGCIHLPKS